MQFLENMAKKIKSFWGKPKTSLLLDLKKMSLMGLVVGSLFLVIIIFSWNKMIEHAFIFSDKKNLTELEKNIQFMVKGYPIEKMVPFIASHRKKTAAFVISVAKKESNWGEKAPTKDGRDCFNYWGYRGQGDSITDSGYTCFASPQEAVATVSRRFNELINDSSLDTPRKMAVWKCGWDCSGHDSEAVEKWISDVDYYFKQLY